MRRVTRLGAAAALLAAGAIGGSAAVVSAHPDHHRGHHNAIQHVLLISVDGMHQSDLDWYIANHPSSELAQLASGGAEFTNNHTSDPSDSDPGGTAIMTGGDPRATGVYYDVEYSHGVFPPGTTTCSGPVPGGNVIYDSPDDTLNAVPDLIPGGTGGPFPSFDEGGSIFPKGDDTNPGAIMNLTPHPQSGLNPATFPVDPKTCQPIMPWDYLKVNSIFQVIQDAGLRTAWSDKHAIYTSFNGHGSGGTSIDDFFGPEIDSQAVEPNGVPYPSDTDWAHDDAATKQYDGYKVQAVINEINGYDHSGKTYVGTPAILGMNFQAVSVAQKVDSASALVKNPDGTYSESPSDCFSSPTPPDANCLAGYYPGTTTPRPLLASALDYVNAQLTAMDNAIQSNPQTRGTTAIIITAKHGQSPQNPLLLKRIKDGPIINAINAAWTAQTGDQNALIVAGTDDDLWQSYLSVKTQDAADFVKHYLWSHSATAVLYNNDGVNRGTEQVPHSGLARIYAGREAARFFGVPYGDPRYPDVFGRVQVGTVYTGGTKIAEHGGDNPNDRDVPLLVYAPGTVRPRQSDAWVETTQVAPTVLRLLGLDPDALDAVRIEGTRVLPGIDEGRRWDR
ncbi:MAG: alkaline phosphatase family protein [Solirubrobacterales bacterium]|nr:alkaline phosphatase family protein [Solirubrobacterales bacterium]